MGPLHAPLFIIFASMGRFGRDRDFFGEDIIWKLGRGSVSATPESCGFLLRDRPWGGDAGSALKCRALGMDPVSTEGEAPDSVDDGHLFEKLSG